MMSRWLGLHWFGRAYLSSVTAVMLALVCAILGFASPAIAQEEVVSSPRELRDFKLEPDKPAQPLPPSSDPPVTSQSAPRPETRSSPQSTSSSVSPPPVLTIPDNLPDFVRERASAASRLETVRRNGEVRPAVQSAAGITQQDKPDTEANSEPSASDDVAVSENTSAAELTAHEDTTSPGVAADSNLSSAALSTIPLWQILAASFVAALSLGAIIWMLRRRKRREDAEDWMPRQVGEEDVMAPAEASLEKSIMRASAATEPAHPVSIATPPKAIAPKIIGVASKPILPILESSFAPLRATISIANLTIKGALKLTNIGDIPAETISLRTRIISASEEHEQQVSAFHADQNSHTDNLGDAAVGETIDMEIDLTIPLRELKTYALKERKLFVPIVLINLEYGPVGARQQLRLSCLIGREATPPTPKMAPLRLDLGPRSFAPLGQRALFG
jgi:hypothetical protein